MPDSDRGESGYEDERLGELERRPEVVAYRVGTHGVRISRLERAAETFAIALHDLAELKANSATKNDVNVLATKVSSQTKAFWWLAGVIGVGAIAFIFWLIEQQLGTG